MLCEQPRRQPEYQASADHILITHRPDSLAEHLQVDGLTAAPPEWPPPCVRDAAPCERDSEHPYFSGCRDFTPSAQYDSAGLGTVCALRFPLPHLVNIGIGERKHMVVPSTRSNRVHFRCVTCCERTCHDVRPLVRSVL